jgi:hypothetical protein
MKMLRKLIVIGGVAMASATLAAIAQQGQQQGPTMGQGAVGPGQGGTMPHNLRVRRFPVCGGPRLTISSRPWLLGESVLR